MAILAGGDQIVIEDAGQAQSLCNTNTVTGYSCGGATAAASSANSSGLRSTSGLAVGDRVIVDGVETTITEVDGSLVKVANNPYWFGEFYAKSVSEKPAQNQSFGQIIILPDGQQAAVKSVKANGDLVLWDGKEISSSSNTAKPIVPKEAATVNTSLSCNDFFEQEYTAPTVADGETVSVSGSKYQCSLGGWTKIGNADDGTFFPDAINPGVKQLAIQVGANVHLGQDDRRAPTFLDVLPVLPGMSKAETDYEKVLRVLNELGIPPEFDPNNPISARVWTEEKKIEFAKRVGQETDRSPLATVMRSLENTPLGFVVNLVSDVNIGELSDHISGAGAILQFAQGESRDAHFSEADAIADNKYTDEEFAVLAQAMQEKGVIANTSELPNKGDLALYDRVVKEFLAKQAFGSYGLQVVGPDQVAVLRRQLETDPAKLEELKNFANFTGIVSAEESDKLTPGFMATGRVGTEKIQSYQKGTYQSAAGQAFLEEAGEAAQGVAQDLAFVAGANVAIAIAAEAGAGRIVGWGVGRVAGTEVGQAVAKFATHSILKIPSEEVLSDVTREGLDVAKREYLEAQRARVLAFGDEAVSGSESFLQKNADEARRKLEEAYRGAFGDDADKVLESAVSKLDIMAGADVSQIVREQGEEYAQKFAGQTSVSDAVVNPSVVADNAFSPADQVVAASSRQGRVVLESIPDGAAGVVDDIPTNYPGVVAEVAEVTDSIDARGGGGFVQDAQDAVGGFFGRFRRSELDPLEAVEDRIAAEAVGDVSARTVDVSPATSRFTKMTPKSIDDAVEMTEDARRFKARLDDLARRIDGVTDNTVRRQLEEEVDQTRGTLIVIRKKADEAIEEIQSFRQDDEVVSRIKAEMEQTRVIASNVGGGNVFDTLKTRFEELPLPSFLRGGSESQLAPYKFEFTPEERLRIEAAKQDLKVKREEALARSRAQVEAIKKEQIDAEARVAAETVEAQQRRQAAQLAQDEAERARLIAESEASAQRAKAAEAEARAKARTANEEQARQASREQDVAARDEEIIEAQIIAERQVADARAKEETRQQATEFLSRQRELEERANRAKSAADEAERKLRQVDNAIAARQTEIDVTIAQAFALRDQYQIVKDLESDLLDSIPEQAHKILVSADYYKILGVSPSATTDEINRAYRSLSKKWHPDVSSQDLEAATLAFKKLTYAKDVLTDTIPIQGATGVYVRRNYYDAASHDAIRQQILAKDPSNFSDAVAYINRQQAKMSEAARAVEQANQRAQQAVRAAEPLNSRIEELQRAREQYLQSAEQHTRTVQAAEQDLQTAAREVMQGQPLTPTQVAYRELNDAGQEYTEKLAEVRTLREERKVAASGGVAGLDFADATSRLDAAEVELKQAAERVKAAQLAYQDSVQSPVERAGGAISDFFDQVTSFFGRGRSASQVADATEVVADVGRVAGPSLRFVQPTAQQVVPASPGLKVGSGVNVSSSGQDAFATGISSAAVADGVSTGGTPSQVVELAQLAANALVERLDAAASRFTDPVLAKQYLENSVTEFAQFVVRQNFELGAARGLYGPEALKQASTTLVGGTVVNGKLLAVSYGDSYIYILRDGKLIKVNEQVKEYLGYNEPNLVSVIIHDLQIGDRVIFASDGFVSFISDNARGKIVKAAGSTNDPQVFALRAQEILRDYYREKGVGDDVTIGSLFYGDLDVKPGLLDGLFDRVPAARSFYISKTDVQASTLSIHARNSAGDIVETRLSVEEVIHRGASSLGDKFTDGAKKQVLLELRGKGVPQSTLDEISRELKRIKKPEDVRSKLVKFTGIPVLGEPTAVSGGVFKSLGLTFPWSEKKFVVEKLEGDQGFAGIRVTARDANGVERKIIIDPSNVDGSYQYPANGFDYKLDELRELGVDERTIQQIDKQLERMAKKSVFDKTPVGQVGGSPFAPANDVAQQTDDVCKVLGASTDSVLGTSTTGGCQKPSLFDLLNPFNKIQPASKIDDVVTVVTSPEETKAIASRLIKTEESTVKMGDFSLSTIKGDDPTNDGLIFYLKPGQNLPKNVVITDKSGNVVDLGKRDTPLLFSDVRKIEIDGTDYSLAHDIWQNPMLFEIRGSSKDAKFDEVIGDITEIWDTAIKSPRRMDAVLAKNFTGEEISAMKKITDFYAQDPNIGGLTAPYDLDTVVELPDDKLAEYLNRTLPFRQVRESDISVFTGLISALKEGRAFTEKEADMFSALEFRHVVATRNVYRGLDEVYITEFNRQFALANMAEAVLSTRLVSKKPFKEHAKHYGDFVELMQSRGVEVPEWVTPFNSDDFRYGIKTDGTKANAAGQYFVSRLEDFDSMAQVLDHERVHGLSKVAYNRNVEFKIRNKLDVEYDRGFASDEGYTDALAYLIKSGGDVDKAIAENAKSTSSYRLASDEILRVAKEVGAASGDEMLGVELLFRGITDRANSSVNRSLVPIQRYYDEKVADSGAKFEERMARFSDKRKFLLMPNPPVSDQAPRPGLGKIVADIRNNSPVFEEQWKTDSFLRSLDDIEKDPFKILAPPGSSDRETAVYRLIGDAVRKDPVAQKEVQEAVNSYYSSYVDILKRVEAQTEIPNTPGEYMLSAANSFSARVQGVGQLITGGFSALNPFKKAGVSVDLKPVPVRSIGGSEGISAGRQGVTEGLVQVVDVGSSQTVLGVGTENVQAKALFTGVDTTLPVSSYTLSQAISEVPEDGGVLSEETLAKSLASSVLEPEGYRIGNNYVLATGEDGNVVAKIPSGRYSLQARPVDTVLLTGMPGEFYLGPGLGAKVFVGVYAADPPVGEAGGEKVVGRAQVIPTNDGELTVQLYDDTNGNGLREAGENTIKWAGVVFTAAQEETIGEVSLLNGWNLVGFSNTPRTVKTASGLVREVVRQGGDVTAISRLVDDRWETYVQRGSETFGNDFPLEAGKGYFVRSRVASTILLGGEPVTNTRIKLSRGWNVVSTSGAAEPITVSAFIDKMVMARRTSEPDVVSRWESGLWDSFVKKAGEDYGNDFPIAPFRGYIIKAKDDVEFEFQ